MLSNTTSNNNNQDGDRQSLLSPGDRVYLYGDRNYTGSLIRSILTVGQKGFRHCQTSYPSGKRYFAFDAYQSNFVFKSDVRCFKP